MKNWIALQRWLMKQEGMFHADCTRTKDARRLYIRIINQRTGFDSCARTIFLVADYWLVNKTQLPIMLREADEKHTMAGVDSRDDIVCPTHSSLAYCCSDNEEFIATYFLLCTKVYGPCSKSSISSWERISMERTNACRYNRNCPDHQNR